MTIAFNKSNTTPQVGDHAAHHNQLGASANDHEIRLLVIREALPSVEDPEIGAAVTNTNFENLAALNTALATGKVHRLPPGRRYQYSGSLQMQIGSGFVGEHKYGAEQATTPGAIESVLNNVGTGPALIAPNHGAGGNSQFAGIKLDGVAIHSGGECLYLPNGAIGVDIGYLYLWPGQDKSAVHHKGFIQDWRIGMLRVEGWHGSTAASARYGWYSDAEPGVGGDACQIDDCRMGYMYLSGCSRHNLHMRVLLSVNLQFGLLRVVNSGRHGAVIVGGFTALKIENFNDEGTGFRYGVTPWASPTTGTVAAGSLNQVTVASATGLLVGDVLTIEGAGAVVPGGSVPGGGIYDHEATITGIAGSVITYTPAAVTPVVGAQVTTGRYDGLYMGPDLGSPEGLGTTLGGVMLGGSVDGIRSGGAQLSVLGGSALPRYSINLSGVLGCHVRGGGFNPYGLLGEPQNTVYDPTMLNHFAPPETMGTPLVVPRPNPFYWRTPTLGTNWSDYGPVAAPPEVTVGCRRVGRRVELRGTVAAAASPAAAMLTLPPGMRPATRKRTTCQIEDGVTRAVTYLFVAADGSVTPTEALDGYRYSLEGLSFALD